MKLKFSALALWMLTLLLLTSAPGSAQQSSSSPSQGSNVQPRPREITSDAFKNSRPMANGEHEIIASAPSKNGGRRNPKGPVTRPSRPTHQLVKTETAPYAAKR